MPGQHLAAGSLVAVVVPSAEQHVEAGFIPERAVGRIQPGHRATVRIAGAQGGQLGARDAVVTRVGSEPARDGLVPVVLAFEGRTESLAHGLVAKVEVAVESLAPFELVLRAAGEAAP